jgi:hypothetical protein
MKNLGRAFKQTMAGAWYLIKGIGTIVVVLAGLGICLRIMGPMLFCIVVFVICVTLLSYEIGRMYDVD